MGKRLFFLTVLCSSWIFSFGQKLDEIHFEGEAISITGERLKSVDGENNVWEIDLKQKEEFKLISDNKQIVRYRFSKMCVQGHTGSRWKSFYEIPLATKKEKKDSVAKTIDLPNFWSSSVLILTPDSLPLDLQSNGRVIATFRLKQHIKYQEITKLNRKEYDEGDTIEVTISENNSNTISIANVKIKLMLDNEHSYELKDNVIGDLIKDGDSATYSVIASVIYSDNAKKEFNLGSIVIHKKKGTLSNWLNILYENRMTLLGAICFLLLLIFLIRFRKQLFKNFKKICSKVRPHNNIADSTDTNSIQKADIDTFQIGHEPTMSDIHNQQIAGYEVCIETLNKRIRELENQLKQPSDGAEFGTLREQIVELEHSETAKLDEIEELTNENKKLKEDNKNLQDQINAITSDNVSKKDLRNKIEELKGDKNKLIREKQSKERELTEARKTITSLETKVKEKDDKISETKKQKDQAESNLRIEKNTTVALQNKINSFSRQTYYLYAIDDTLQAVDNSLKSLFANVHDDNLMKRLAQPVLSGTAGLDAGLESYMTEWKDTIYNNQSLFFGSEVISMSDESVKEKLTDFLEQLALRDSFGKLVRLYLMTNVGWINEKMVEAGFDVDAIQTLFVRFKNLFQLFNIDISYPHLFVDKFESSLHKDNMRCEIFNYFEPSEELLKKLKNRDNENLIVDVTRIGIPNSKNPTRRNAMVSLPNF